MKISQTDKNLEDMDEKPISPINSSLGSAILTQYDTSATEAINSMISSDNGDFKTKVAEEGKQNIHEDHYLVTLFFHISILVSLIGSVSLIPFCYTYWEERRNLIPEGYNVPQIYDLYHLLYLIVFLCAVKEGIAKSTNNIADSIISNKFTGEALIANKKKIVSHFFKLFYYSSVSIIGYLICKKLDFFPWELLGDHDFMDIFKDGMPKQLFFNKPDYFDIYYLTSLAFVILDLIYLVFINEKQSDYNIMILHHICTISLVGYSFLTNGSHVGVIVFYLHDFTDIFVSITRITILTDLKDEVKLFSGAILLVVFVYYRLIVFGKYTYQTFMHLNDWHIFNIILWPFLIILYTMHVYWVYSIVKRFASKKIEDVGVRKDKRK